MYQGIFSFLVISGLSQPSFTDEDTQSYVLWRLNTAHDARHVDSRGTSLAARVCSGDVAIESSEGQADAYGNLSAYFDNYGYVGTRTDMCEGT